MKLKPCPFCGGEATIYTVVWGRYVVGCETGKCYCNTMTHDLPIFIDEQEAIEAWNRRADDV